MWSALSILFAQEAGAAIKRRVMAAVLYAVAGIVALMGLVFALIAFHTWLTFRMQPVAAGLTIAGGLFVIALILALVAGAQTARRPRRSAVAPSALVAAPVAASVIKALPKTTPWMLAVLGGTALVGFLATRALRSGRDSHTKR